MMKDSGPAKKYSVEGMLLELEKWRKVTLADGRVMTTEMTRNQRTIPEALDLMHLISPGGSDRSFWSSTGPIGCAGESVLRERPG